jgi:hypothetical protein
VNNGTGKNILSNIENQRENVASLRSGLLELLEGMNYCLDWKQEDADWSAREIVYHLLDTPPGGMAEVVKGIVSGQINEYEIWSDRSNITEARATLDMTEIESDIAGFFDVFNAALAAAGDADLQGRRVLMLQRTRGQNEERTLETALAGFDRHWRAHLEQLGELRSALGF